MDDAGCNHARCGVSWARSPGDCEIVPIVRRHGSSPSCKYTSINGRSYEALDPTREALTALN